MIEAKIDIGGIELIRDHSAAWRNLCQETSSPPFHRPEWIEAYLNAFTPGNEIVLVTARDGEKLVAVLPLVRKRCWFAGVPVVKLSGAGNVHSVRFDLAICNGEMGEAAVKAIWDLLQRTAGWQLLELPVFPEKGPCDQLLSLAMQSGYQGIRMFVHDSPILRMQTDTNGRLTWLSGTSRHFRHELRRFARLLEEETGDKPKLVSKSDVDEKLLKEFYELEAAGWKGEEGSAIQCGPETKKFYDRIASEASQRGYFRMYSLEAKSAMVAGAFAVSTENCLYPMKIAHNESLRRAGPGQLLFNSIFEECAGKGIGALCFGGKKDRYKTAWTEDTLPHYTGFIFSRGLRGQAAYGMRTQVLSRLGALRRRIKSRFEAAKKEKEKEKVAAKGNNGNDQAAGHTPDAASNKH